MQLGLMRFKQYIFGQQVTVDTDQKPLVGLLDKPVAECSLRIQRMRLQLKSFDFLLNYKPGKKLFIADALSSAHLPIFLLMMRRRAARNNFILFWIISSLSKILVIIMCKVLMRILR